jgi:hypothetical protein
VAVGQRRNQSKIPKFGYASGHSASWANGARTDMGFFKTKKDVAEFSRTHYEKYLFGLMPGGRDFLSVYAESIHRTVSEKDSRFASVEIQKLKHELLALQLEMTALAWNHKSNERAAMENSLFTKKYLVEKGRSDLWELMGEYNQVLVASITYGVDLTNRFTRATHVTTSKIRADVFDSRVAEGHDAEAVARSLNHQAVWVHNTWKKGTAPTMLGVRLMLRVGSEGSSLISHQLTAVAIGFYQGASEALDGVKLAA